MSRSMISFEQIKNFYPTFISDNPQFQKYILKEYFLLSILDFLSHSKYIKSLSFIGGTSLRLTKGIDRFSENLDFDCKDFPESAFNNMTGDIINFLRRNGLDVELKENRRKLNAFRSNLIFPELLYDLGLSGHREERFLIKLECQDQQFTYTTQIADIKGCGYFFPMPVPPLAMLCSMKIAAMLDRKKGRDFYDVMFLLSQTEPDFQYLANKLDISNIDQLKKAVEKTIDTIDLKIKVRDFQHLLLNKENSRRILRVKEFFPGLK